MLTITDWLAVASVAAPLCVKALSDWHANLSTRHNEALARIVGMASRQAATIGRTLASMPPGASAADVERTLVANAVVALNTEMAGSTTLVGAGQTALTGIIQGELDKLTVPAVAMVPMPATPATGR